MSSMPSKCLLLIFPLSSGTEKLIAVRSGEQTGCSNTVISLVAKLSLTGSACELALLGQFLHTSFSYQNLQLGFSCFSVDVELLYYALDSQLAIFTHNLTNFCNVFFGSACFLAVLISLRQ
jgi:hypothetical protein